MLVYMLFVLIYMLYALCHIFLCFVPLFCSMLMLGLLAHMFNIMSMVMPCLHLHVCMHVLCSHASMPSHACMLGFAFSHAFMFRSTWSDVYPYAYMRISMLACVDPRVYMLRSMFSTCFILSSMCLSAPCHVCMLRPRPCLSCLVLL